MVVGSMVGSGIFPLPRTFGIATGPFGVIIAWCIAAGGVYTPARVLQFRAIRTCEGSRIFSTFAGKSAGFVG